MTATRGAALADEDRLILDIESKTFRYYGAKERVIRERTGMLLRTYLVRLDRLLGDPAALEYAPAVVNRLRARRERRERWEGGGGG